MTTALFDAPDTISETVAPEPAALDAKGAALRFGLQDAAIAKMKEEYLPLKIDGVDDKDGYDAVHKARMVCVKARTGTEKKRNELNAEAKTWIKGVNDEAKRITGLLAPIEDHLAKEEDSYDRQKEAIKNAAKIKADAEEKARKEAEEAARLAEVKAEQDRLAAERAKMDADLGAFREEKAKAIADANARQAALDAQQKAIEAAQAAERKKIEDEAAAERAKLKAAQDKIDAERKAQEAEAARLAKIETDRVHAEEVAKARAEAAERARVETEARLAQEAALKEAAAIKRQQEEAAAKEQAERLRPDREKLLLVANFIRTGVIVPEVFSPEAMEVKARILRVIDRAAAEIRDMIVAAMPANIAERETGMFFDDATVPSEYAKQLVRPSPDVQAMEQQIQDEADTNPFAE